MAPRRCGEPRGRTAGPTALNEGALGRFYCAVGKEKRTILASSLFVGLTAAASTPFHPTATAFVLSGDRASPKRTSVGPLRSISTTPFVRTPLSFRPCHVDCGKATLAKRSIQAACRTETRQCHAAIFVGGVESRSVVPLPCGADHGVKAVCFRCRNGYRHYCTVQRRWGVDGLGACVASSPEHPAR